MRASSTWIEAFAGWSLARALQLIPLTPGGVGPVELGMTGILVGFGGANAEVVAAVLLYRAFTIVPTLLLGLATIAAWRWLGPGRSREGRSRCCRGESARRVKEQSHKDEMSAAIRGDFRRLRERGVAATLAPRDADRPERARSTSCQSPRPQSRRSATAVEPTGPEADPGEAAEEPVARPGFFARILGY